MPSMAVIRVGIYQVAIDFVDNCIVRGRATTVTVGFRERIFDYPSHIMRFLSDIGLEYRRMVCYGQIVFARISIPESLTGRKPCFIMRQVADGKSPALEDAGGQTQSISFLARTLINVCILQPEPIKSTGSMF
jgi:hypothetical protein